MQSAATRPPSGGADVLCSEAVIPWKSARYVCITFVERPYRFIIVSLAWQLAQSSGLLSRHPGACGPAMS
jgi:hypothetical protein